MPVEGSGGTPRKKPVVKKITVAKKKAVKRAPAKKTTRKKPAAKKASIEMQIVGRHVTSTMTSSVVANPLHGKKRAVARVVSKLRLAAVKVQHTVALTGDQQRAAKRAQVVAFCKWGIAHAADIHYAEIRPIPAVVLGKLPSLPFTTDCSGFATMAYQYAGLPNPNGDDWEHRSTEYTGTLLEHGHPTQPARPADIGVYGPKPGHHAVIALNAGGSMLASHGGEQGPLLIAAAIEQQYQPTPLTWLDLEALA